MKIHGRFYLSKNNPDYKMTHQLFTLFWIISNILTFHFYTFSVIYTFYFYIAFEELTFYQKCSIKCVLYSLFYFRTIAHAIREIAVGTAKMGALVTHEDEDSLSNNSYLDVHKLVPNVKCEVNFFQNMPKSKWKRICHGFIDDYSQA